MARPAVLRVDRRPILSSQRGSEKEKKDNRPFHEDSPKDLIARRLQLESEILPKMAGDQKNNRGFLTIFFEVGYGFGWIGHAFFEKNVPTTSTYPVYSFCAYWVMMKDVLTGRLKF